MELPDYIPPGRLGSHKSDDKLFQVQTEFARRPRQRIVTSVIVDGRVLHKVEKEWNADLSDTSTHEPLDDALAAQHAQAMELVRTRAQEFLGQLVASSPPSGYPEPTFRDAMREVLSTVAYVSAMYEFDAEGKITFQESFSEIGADWGREFEALAEMVFGLPDIIRVGLFRCGTVRFGAENILAVTVKGRAFGIATEPTATVESLEKDFPELFEVEHAG